MNYLPDWLESLAGNTVGMVAAVFAYCFVWFLAWGLWTALILGKAGFNHKPFWCLYLPLNLPVLTLPIAVALLYQRETASEYYFMLFILSLWAGTVLLALVPWPLRQKPKPKKLNLNDAASHRAGH